MWGDERGKRPGSLPLPEAQVMELRAFARNYDRHDRFAPGDLVQPVPNGPAVNVAPRRPHLIVEALGVPLRNFKHTQAGETTTQTYGQALDVRVLCFTPQGNVAAFWAESWMFEPYTGQIPPLDEDERPVDEELNDPLDDLLLVPDSDPGTPEPVCGGHVSPVENVNVPEEVLVAGSLRESDDYARRGTIRERAIAWYRDHMSESDARHALEGRGGLGRTFTWAESPHGHEFWLREHTRLLNDEELGESARLILLEAFPQLGAIEPGPNVKRPEADDADDADDQVEWF